MEKTIDFGFFERPYICSRCSGQLIFKGVGEYHCEDCEQVEYDDYGKVRLFLEKNKRANMTEIQQATGVSMKSIKQMVKEKRFEITQDSKVFMYCERCHAVIRMGRFCNDCEIKYHRELEAKMRAENREGKEGIGTGMKGAKGAKRFERTQHKEG